MHPEFRSMIRFSSIAWLLLATVVAVFAQTDSLTLDGLEEQDSTDLNPYLVVLGTAQDAGSPQIGCTKACCAKLQKAPDLSRMITCLGLIDPQLGHRYLFEATPHIRAQLARLHELAPLKPGYLPDAIFLTHAHIGHYTGLMYLGKEAMDTRGIAVYALPRMRQFIANEAPWKLLVKRQNIRLRPLSEGLLISVSENIKVTPLVVPHRDEFSETAAFLIEGPNKKALFIPDIDKWERWEKDLVAMIQGVDYALLDATFYDGSELPGRDMKQIPHPFVIESMQLLNELPNSEKAKVFFIHLNHTNPLWDRDSEAFHSVTGQGFNVAETGLELRL